MRIATWNVNSIRSRVAGWSTGWSARMSTRSPCRKSSALRQQFPFEPFAEAGYDIELNGLNQWNGVAFASRLPMTDATPRFENMPGFLKGSTGTDLPLEARALGVTAGGVRLWSLYVPNGRALGDPHYLYKLDWLARLRGGGIRLAEQRSGAAAGADGRLEHRPAGHGCLAHLGLREQHAHLRPRARGLRRDRTAGLTDVVRPLIPVGFTYWDYKQLRFPRNEGMRIDFILGSKPFADLVTAASIHRNERKGDAPSDHVPVVVDLDLQTEDDDDRPMIF